MANICDTWKSFSILMNKTDLGQFNIHHVHRQKPEYDRIAIQLGDSEIFFFLASTACYDESNNSITLTEAHYQLTNEQTENLFRQRL